MPAQTDAGLRGVLRARATFAAGRPDIAADERPGAVLIDMIRAGQIAPAARPATKPPAVKSGQSMAEVIYPFPAQTSEFEDEFEDEFTR